MRGQTTNAPAVFIPNPTADFMDVHPDSVDPDNTVFLFDLDGTMNVFSFTSDSPEVEAYIRAAVEFVVREIPALGSSEKVLQDVLATIEKQVFPFRDAPKNWAQLPDADGIIQPTICPAVDHYLLTQKGIVLLLGMIQETSQNKVLLGQIARFIESNQLCDGLYLFASSESLPHATIDDEARGVLEDCLSKGWLVALFTNSTTSKAQILAEKVGFGGRLVVDRLEKGKLGLYGQGNKGEISHNWNNPDTARFGNAIDVSRFYGAKPGQIIVNLRRKSYHDKIADILRTSGKKYIAMIGDIAALDLLPLGNWPHLNPVLLMRTHPFTSSGDALLARKLLGARIAPTLSELFDMM